MPFGARRGSGILILTVLLGVAPALAQTTTGPVPSTWTDPPVRGSAGPDAPAAKAVEAPRAKDEAARPFPARTEAAAARRSIRHARRAPVARVREAARTPERRWAVRERIAPTREARSPHRRAGRFETAAVEPPRRIDRRRGPGRYYATPEAARLSYGRLDAPRRLDWAETGDGPEDLRAVRFAQGRPPAYRVMRLRTVTFPDGRVVQSLRPYDTGPDDDF